MEKMWKAGGREEERQTCFLRLLVSLFGEDGADIGGGSVVLFGASSTQVLGGTKRPNQEERQTHTMVA